MGNTILRTIEVNGSRLLHPGNILRAACAGLCLLGGSVATAAEFYPLDLDQFPAGRIMDNEFTLSYGVTVSGLRRTGGTNAAPIFDPAQNPPGILVLYDSTNVGGADPDLEGPPWDLGNAEFLIAGNLLICQTNTPSSFIPTAGEIAAGQIPAIKANDHGPGALIAVTFDLPMKTFRFHWADLDVATGGVLRFRDSSVPKQVDIPYTQFLPGGFFQNVLNGPVAFGDNSFDIVDDMPISAISAWSVSQGGPTFDRFDYVEARMSVSGGFALISAEPLHEGTIGDFVWNDLNGDGIQDPGEPGIQNVAVELYIDNGNGTPELGAGDVLFRRQFTNEQGGYDFLGLPAGNYWVRWVDINGVISGTQTNVATIPNPHFVALGVGEDYNDADFGFNLNTGAIGDRVWSDFNSNANQDGGEPGIQNVTMALYRDLGTLGVYEPGIDVLLATTTTGLNGMYLFPGLQPGNYVVRVTDNANVITGALTTGNQPFFYTLGLNEVYLDADFGYNQPTGSIGDFVWFDANANGIQDGGPEIGVPNVTVRLWRDQNNSGQLDPELGDVLIATATTDANGNYLFEGLPPAVGGRGYFVQVTDENKAVNLAIHTSLAFFNPATEIALGSGQNFLTADFGYWADGPLAVILNYFTAEPNAAGDRLVLVWETDIELASVGFDVYRWENGTRGEKVNTVMIMAEGSDMAGARYELLDPLPYGAGDLRAYLLVETELYGTTQAYGPFWSTKEATVESAVEDWLLF